MHIPSNYYIFVNIVIVLIYIVAIVVSLKNGFLSQILSLIYSFLSLFIAWFISPILASYFPIVNLSGVESKIYGPLVNSLIYCIIVFIVLKIIYLFIAPLLKSVSKIPVIGFLNKIGGLLLGLINASIVVLLISVLLKMPIIENGREVKDNTLFKYVETLSDNVLLLSIKNLNFSFFVDKIDDFNVEEGRKALTQWMIDKGIINENISRD